MDTAVFLSKILSEEGLIVLAEFRGGSMKRHHFLPNFDEASRRVKALNDSGAEVYHGCATYKSDEGRKQANVARVKSFWVDIDVGKPDSYQTRNEAKDALGELCKALEIHLPYIVSSGAGLHCYWVFDAAVSGDVWKAGAQLFRQVLDDFKFKHDPSRTTDQASILRPVGSTWRKVGEKPVKILFESVTQPFGWYTVKFNKYLGSAEVPLAPPSRKYFDILPVEKLGRVAEYPPSSAIEVANKCGQLARMRDFKGAVSEPEWRNAIGVIKHTVEGEELAHEWSKGDPRYDYKQTQDKIDRWETGPTTCEQFERTFAHICNSCSFKGKVTSPIQLGYVETKEVPEALTQPENIDASVIDYSAMFPRGFRWDEESKRMLRLVKNKDGVPEWIAFADSFFHPTTRIRLPDNTWAQRIRMQVSKGRWREFEMPTKFLSNADQIRAQLAAHEIVIHPKMGQHAIDYTHQWLEQYKALSIETQMFKEFGWHMDGTAFLIGDNLITQAAESKVILSEGISLNLRKLTGEGYKGSDKEWARIFNYIYNRPGAEAYQFTAMGLLAAPLVGILGVKDWHGIPIALTGASSQGKSAVGAAACSAYGVPEAFFLAGANATAASFDPHIGTLHNLPVVFDEVTGREAEVVSKKLYSVSTGESRDRATNTGKASDVKFTWNTISLITGNTNLMDSLARLDLNQADASQVRVFEYIMPPDALKTVFPNVDAQTLIFDDLGTKHYGSVGRVAIREMMRQRQHLCSEFEKYRKLFGQKSSTYDPKERFYVDLIATAYVGAKLFRELGYLEFDIANVKDWALDHMIYMRSARTENLATPEDRLAQFLATLYGNIMVTKYTNQGLEAPMEAFPIRGEIKARMATSERKFYVSYAAFEAWCYENKTHSASFRKELTAQGFIVPDIDRISLTKNTSFPSSRQRVIAFDYDKVIMSETGKSFANKVVSIK